MQYSKYYIFGRKILKFEDILKKVTEEKIKEFGERSVGPEEYPNMIETILKAFKLKCKKINSKDARLAVMNGRPCLCIMILEENNLNTFNKFFGDNNNKKKIFKEENFNFVDKNKNDIKYKGHVVVLTSIEENCLKFLNSYGNNWEDQGYSRLKDENVFLKASLRERKFLDVYWDKDDLSEEEIELFNNNYLSFIKQASNYLMDSNKDIKKELEKEFKCPNPKCEKSLNLEYFELKFYQEHKKNDEADSRKLKVKCLNCQYEFESDEITTLLYLKNICS